MDIADKVDALGTKLDALTAAVAAITIPVPAPAAPVDLSPVLAAIADLKEAAVADFADLTTRVFAISNKLEPTPAA